MIENTIIIPRYRSFEHGDRRYEVNLKTNFESSSSPIENLISNSLEYSFKDNYTGDSSKYILLSFPCLVSIKALSIHQKISKANGLWRFEYYNELTGIWVNLTVIPFNLSGTIIPVILTNNWGRRYRLVHASGNIDKTAIIQPLRLQLQKKVIEL